MKEMARLLNDMRAEGVIADYALFGAAAQMRYTEPVATLDADVLVAIPSGERLDVLGPICEFCSRKGYRPEGEAEGPYAHPRVARIGQRQSRGDRVPCAAARTGGCLEAVRSEVARWMT